MHGPPWAAGQLNCAARYRISSPVLKACNSSASHDVFRRRRDRGAAATLSQGRLDEAGRLQLLNEGLEVGEGRAAALGETHGLAYRGEGRLQDTVAGPAREIVLQHR